MGSRKLIVNCDDFGMHRSINTASLALLQRSSTFRASLMPPGNFFDEAVAALKSAGIHHCGVHLTMNSEFKKLPTTPLTRDASLCDTDGFFLASVAETRARNPLKAIMRECEAQIEKVLAQGLAITHLDSHMFFSDEEVWGDTSVLEIVQRLANQLEVPFRDLRQRNTVFVWDTHPDAVSRYQFYDQTLRALPERTTEIILHPAMDEPTLSFFTTSGPRRVADYQYFSDPNRGVFEQNQALLW